MTEATKDKIRISIILAYGFGLMYLVYWAYMLPKG